MVTLKLYHVKKKVEEKFNYDQNQILILFKLEIIIIAQFTRLITLIWFKQWFELYVTLSICLSM